MGDRFLSSAGAGGNCARPMRLPDPGPVLDTNRAPMGPENFPVLGLGSGERRLWHFQTPVLYWINFSLREKHKKESDRSKVESRKINSELPSESHLINA